MSPSHPTFPLDVLVSLHGAERVAELMAAGLVDPGGEPRAVAPPPAPLGSAPELPPLRAMTASAARAIARTATLAAAGRPVLASEAEQARRQRVCERCDWYRASDARCALCGCHMRVKLRLAGEVCPRGKW